ncbi:MAG: RIP metalloprotease RseP [Gemmatimonadetes bacterium 13_1_40CM_2_70_7]|nr:MAG: RIP metalloprotease RseP [Gemmatimonadetes bacterium 13_1_40CM_3_70_6]OLD42474.1 MAG: RIP metalloprotease RseP [Gemmatimonadetes bacterium 13_1_40CM_2_70_7]
MLTVVAFLVVIGVLIFVHEAGHFLAAKAVGVQVLRFSLGFGRPILAWHRGETEYWISWLPIGGYVKMAGMEDEGMSGELEGGKSSVPVDPARAFDRQPIWARAVVLAAGVTMNVVLAFVVYTGLAATVGASRTNTTQVDTVWASLLPKGGEALAQLRQGDRIVAINGDTVRTWEDVLTELATEPAPLRIAVAERPAPIVLDVPRGDQEARGALLRALESFFPCRIDVVTPGLPADRAGLKPGDLVVRANGDTVLSWTQFTRLVRRSVHRPVAVTVWRDGRTVDVRLVPERQFGPDPHTGEEVAYGFAGIGATTPITRQRFGVIGAIGEGARNTVTSAKLIVSIVRGLFTGELSLRQLGGPIAIGQQSGQAARAGLVSFLAFLALISINLAILNLLPVPILDGGQLMFLAAEAIRRQPLSLSVRLRLTQLGFLFIIALLLLATSNDLIRIFNSVFHH